MVDRLKEIDGNKLSESYKKIVEDKMTTKKYNLGKIKYSDKVLHESKIIKYFLGRV